MIAATYSQNPKATAKFDAEPDPEEHVDMRPR